MNNEKNYDLKKRTFVFSLEIIRLLKTFERSYIADVIGKQLLRCATSIGANIVEAQSAPSKKDFANFFNISLKSANETLYWLSLLKHSGIGKKDKIDLLVEETQEICKIIAKSLITMRGK
jgi:four helix bundle protein